MIYGSVCSGIEAATVAWRPLGWRAAFVSEIAPFPRAVLAHRLPDVPNRGDMRKFQEWPHDEIDVLIGGTPCESFSRAGPGTGAADERGALLHEFVRVLAAFRPRWFVLENVPGLLSARRGRDFGALLGAVAQLGYGWAYRSLDAQHVGTSGFPAGVPQRRLRVYVVGCLGGVAPAASALFDEHGRCRGPDASRKAKDEAAANTVDCFDLRSNESAVYGGGRSSGRLRVAATLTAGAGGSDRYDFATENFVVHRDSSGHHVRVLTPCEREMLQGFSGTWTSIPFAGKPIAADRARNEAIGRSMPVNVIRWIGARIQEEEWSR